MRKSPQFFGEIIHSDMMPLCISQFYKTILKPKGDAQCHRKVAMMERTPKAYFWTIYRVWCEDLYDRNVVPAFQGGWAPTEMPAITNQSLRSSQAKLDSNSWLCNHPSNIWLDTTARELGTNKQKGTESPSALRGRLWNKLALCLHSAGVLRATPSSRRHSRGEK